MSRPFRITILLEILMDDWNTIRLSTDVPELAEGTNMPGEPQNEAQVGICTNFECNVFPVGVDKEIQENAPRNAHKGRLGLRGRDCFGFNL